MKKTGLFFFYFLFTITLMAQLPKVCKGKLIRLEHFTSAYVQPRNIDIWLPENYDGKKKFAVLYMHDGQMLFDSSTTWNKQAWDVDDILSDLIQKKLIKNCIVVGIWNTGSYRTSEYIPQKPFETLPAEIKKQFLPELKDTAQADDYLRFIVKELKPYIDKNYAVLPTRSNTFISGSSKGGLISLYAICEYPDVFGAAACLSTHWVGSILVRNDAIPAAFEQYLLENLPDPHQHKLYFDYGDKTIDSLYKPYQLIVDAIVKQRGYSEKNWMTIEFKGEDHSENAWRKRFHIPVTFILGKTGPLKKAGRP